MKRQEYPTQHKTKKYVTAVEFVTCWENRKGDLGGVSQELNMSRAAVSQRVDKYRKKGIKLTIKRKPGTTLDVQGLNQLIKSLK